MADIQSIKNRFGIIGNSSALNYALDVAVQVAPTDLSVLIYGESGVGKEAFSQIIHSLSTRRHNSFIAVNCGAIPEGTIDSELFGHEKGSFTGAADNRKGYFETVNGGTIFLDEIAEMPLGTQARLLRILESGEYLKVGSSKVQKTDVRVIAATNKDLLELAHKGRFRLDLYYRLSTVPIRIPALRDRKEDIPVLFRKFVIDFSERHRTNPVQLDESGRQMLMNYPWRGNVRELKNIAEQVSVLSRKDMVSDEDLQNYLHDKPLNNLPVLAGHSPHGDFVTESTFTTERDLLYKIIFDMKKDLNEVKAMFVELMKNGADGMHINYQPSVLEPSPYRQESVSAPLTLKGATVPVYVQAEANGKGGFNSHEEVEDSLSLVDMEKELIIKALKKHKSKRKDAALDLGISERTLYRKLKEYDIEHI